MQPIWSDWRADCVGGGPVGWRDCLITDISRGLYVHVSLSSTLTLNHLILSSWRPYSTLASARQKAPAALFLILLILLQHMSLEIWRDRISFGENSFTICLHSSLGEFLLLLPALIFSITNITSRMFLETHLRVSISQLSTLLHHHHRHLDSGWILSYLLSLHGPMLNEDVSLMESNCQSLSPLLTSINIAIHFKLITPYWHLWILILLLNPLYKDEVETVLPRKNDSISNIFNFKWQTPSSGLSNYDSCPSEAQTEIKWHFCGTTNSTEGGGQGGWIGSQNARLWHRRS